MAPGRIVRQLPGETRIGSAWKDGSVTILAVCTETADLASSPRLTGDHVVYSFGGSLQQTSKGWVNYVYYPSTDDDSLTVDLGAEGDTTILFPDAPPAGCGLRARPPFRVTACGSLVVVEWNTQIETARRVQGVDISVTDASTGEDLGYYQERVSSQAGRMSVRFGFRDPTGARVRVAISRYYVGRDQGVDEIGVSPPLEAMLRLGEER